jgi:DNA-binding NarL/FixJ family response regulator
VFCLGEAAEFPLSENLLSAATPVFLVAENRLLREALVRVLSKKSDVAVVGATALDHSTLSQMVAAHPEVILLDSESLVFESPRLVERIHEVLPDAKAVLIGMERDEATFFRALRENVIGYVLKEASALEIIGAIRAVAAGEAAFPTCFSRALVRCATQQFAGSLAHISSSPHGLSRREQQLVELVRAGLTNKEIATRLNLAEQTIKNHVHRILRKVGAADRITMVERCQARPPAA